MMTDNERREEIRHLVEEIGMEPADAALVLEDDDLWILIPECRHGFASPEEAVREWEEAFRFARALSRGFADPGGPEVNDATRQLLWDLRDRADEALARARARAQA